MKNVFIKSIVLSFALLLGMNTYVAQERDIDLKQSHEMLGKAPGLGGLYEEKLYESWLDKEAIFESIELPQGGEVKSVAISGNNAFIVTASILVDEDNPDYDEGSTVCIWNARTGKLLRTLKPEGYVDSVAINFDGTVIVTGSIENIVQMWNAQSGEVIHTFHPQTTLLVDKSEDREEPLYSSIVAAMSSDGNFIAGGSTDGTVYLWDAHTKELIKTVKIKDKFSIDSIAMSSDGNTIALGSDTYSYSFVWMPLLDTLMRLTPEDSIGGSRVAISSGGGMVVTSSDKTRIWHIDSRGVWRTIETSPFTFAVAISSDIKFVVTVSNDPIVRIWSVQTKELVHTLSGHKKAVQSVAISPNRSFIVTGSNDGTARIWRLVLAKPTAEAEEKREE